MKMTYDHTIVTMYIELTNNPIVSTRRVNPNFLLDLDEHDQVVGIEILNARKSGIDPLTITSGQFTPNMTAERPDPEAIQAGRAAMMEARKHKRQQETKVVGEIEARMKS